MAKTLALFVADTGIFRGMNIQENPSNGSRDTAKSRCSSNKVSFTIGHSQPNLDLS